jgi:hypothetical protein
MSFVGQAMLGDDMMTKYEYTVGLHKQLLGARQRPKARNAPGSYFMYKYITLDYAHRKRNNTRPADSMA